MVLMYRMYGSMNGVSVIVRPVCRGLTPLLSSTAVGHIFGMYVA
jgi:hypothetical protein